MFCIGRRVAAISARRGIFGVRQRALSSWGWRGTGLGTTKEIAGTLGLVGFGLVCFGSVFGCQYGESEGLAEKETRRRKASRPRLISQNSTHYEYVIIGAGTAAYTALEVIRHTKPNANVLLISEDQTMARIDVDTQGEGLPASLQDVYNEWRRHISCRLGTERHANFVGASSNVRKWSTRRCDSDDGSFYEQRGGSLVGSSGGPPGEDEVFGGCVSLMVDNDHGLKINPEDKVITLSDGSEVQYDKCLVAPPGKPRELYVLKSSLQYTLRDKLNSLRDIQEFHDLYRVAKEGGKKIVVIGGGYLGTTLSAALLELNKTMETKNEITQMFVESAPLNQYFPDYLTAHIMKKLNGLQLEVLPDRLVTGVSRCVIDSETNNTTTREEDEKEKVSVTMMQGSIKEHVDADYVVLASTNVDPDVHVAKRSQLEIDRKNGGIVVNSALEAFDGLFVAGSSASFHDVSLGRRRVDFYDNALNTGLLAGQNMVNDDGRLQRYRHQPTFRTYLPGTGMLFEAVGEIDSDMRTVGLWLSQRDSATGKPLKKTAYERGIVYYIQNNIVVGVLCCNASECLEGARDVIREGLPFKEASKRILLAPEQWIRVYETK